MSNKEFEKVVLEKLNTLTTDVKGLKQDVSSLNKKMDRLDDKLDDQTLELKQTIRHQWSYIDQAFNRITDIQNTQYTR